MSSYNAMRYIHVTSYIRDYIFSQRIIYLWNKLPEYAVVAKSVNSFKNILNKSWYNVPYKLVSNMTGRKWAHSAKLKKRTKERHMPKKGLEDKVNKSGNIKCFIIVGILSNSPSPSSSVVSDVGCQSMGCKFESQLGQHSFRRLTKVTVTCAIRLSTMGCLTVYVEKQPVALKVCCVVYWCGKTRKRMSR